MKGCAIKFGRWEEKEDRRSSLWFATDVRRGKSDKKDHSMPDTLE